MRRMLLWLAAAGALAIAPSIARAAPAGHPPTPGGGLATTPHDFTQAAYNANPQVGLCTFCHTPHKAQSSALLWNHAYSTATYAWVDQTTTQAGTPLPTFTSTWNGPSPKCLSCHDGSVAVGDIKWFDAKAQTVSLSNVSGEVEGGKIVNSAFQIGGTNMNGNHPVVVPYPGAGTKNYAGGATGVGAVTAEWNTDPTAKGIVLFAASDNTLGASIRRVTGGPTGTQNLGIECASCHDPHNKLSQDIYFLRGKLTGTTDYICTKCHVK